MKKYRTMRVTRKALPKRTLHFKFIPALLFLLLILVPVSILLAYIPVNGKSTDTSSSSGTNSAVSSASSTEMSTLISSTAAESTSSAPQSESSKSVSSINSNIPSSKQSGSSKTSVISSENAPSINTAMDQKAQQFTSNTRYLILVDLQSQTVGIYNGSKEHWMLVHSYICSSGSGGEDATPTGTFTIQGRGTWFFNPTVQEGAEWWTQFSGNYLFHSLPMDKNHNVLDSTLGEPRSHGCIRLDIANAKWIYDNISKGTKVVIY